MVDNQVWARNEDNQKNAFSKSLQEFKSSCLIKIEKAYISQCSIASFLPHKDLKTQDFYGFVSAECTGGKKLCSQTELVQPNASN